MNGRQDPNQPDLERRLILAIILSMLVLFATPYLFRLFYPEPPGEAPAGVISAPVETPEPEPTPPEVKGPAGGEAEGNLPSGEEQLETEAVRREIEVENAHLLLRFDTAGAVLTSVRLKEYQDTHGENLELIPQEIPLEMPRPLSLQVSDPRVEFPIDQVVYEVDGVQDRLEAPAELRFLFRRASLEIVRTVRIPPEGYRLEVETTVRLQGRAIPHTVILGAGLGELDPAAASDFQYPAVAYYLNGSVVRYYDDDLEEGPVQVEVSPRWVGLDSKYFTYLMVNPGPVRQVRMVREVWNLPAQEEPPQNAREVILLRAEVGLNGAGPFTFFIGPKKPEILSQVDPTLPDLIDYGWFSLLVKPLLFCLKWINASVENYGWAIIILTFLINLALFPVRYKQIVSMKKMTEIQPKLRSIQDKYKRMKRDDPRRQQMNAEVMALYKEHGVNPLGGCLPLLIQMPFLFAFYRMLDASIELRGAPFILWIHDLSKADPYYITPIVMGATMVAQQKMTPATGDPTQRRMMMILPVVFTFFFLGLSSGLVLYFLFSNVFAMMFQAGLQKFKPELIQGGPSSPKKKSRSKSK